MLNITPLISCNQGNRRNISYDVYYKYALI